MLASSGMAMPAVDSAGAGRVMKRLAIAGVAGILLLATEPMPVEAQGGCISAGKLYPEGAVVKPPLRSRLYVRGYFVCRGGAWVFVKT